MKPTFETILLIAALSSFGGEALAQVTVLSDSFDSYSSGAFGSAYNFGDAAAGPASAIVAPGAGGAGQALQFSANLHSGTNANTGVNLPAYSATGNVSPDLSDYTLSFDLAIAGADPGAFFVALNIFGPGGADGVEYDIGNGSLPSAGTGFKHFSVNMGTLPHAYNVTLLNPADSQYNFQLVLLGFPPSVTATPEAILLDNLQVTMTANTNTGTTSFVNPPIYADYPDPDIIRVGNDFYFSTTTFIDVPGLTLLHSRDLVHWEIVTHLVPQLTGSPNYNITNGVQNYGNGVFASSLRYYNGMFYCAETQNGQSTRIYYSTNIAGPWQFNQLSVGAFDPGLFIENGTGYIVTAGGWQSNTTFYTLNSTFSGVIATHVITNGLGLEGSHVVKRGSYYYIFNAQPSTASLYVSRATNLFGPYTFMKNLDDGHGGHQGAIVDMPDGSDFGFVMKDSGTIGRMTYISPIIWSNNWPIWGLSNAPGRVPTTGTVPIAGAPAYSIPTSDDFSSPTLGPQWQWNHNPDNTRWSLTDRPGFLRLHPTGATNFWYARNTLIQKGLGPTSGAEVKFDLSHLLAGDNCGLGALGKSNGTITVTCNSPGDYTLSQKLIVSTSSSKNTLINTTVATASYTNTIISLRLGMDFTRNKGTVFYSANGRNWTQLGGQFNIAYDWLTGTFQGEQYAIFCFNAQPGSGYVDVDWFRLEPPPVISDIVVNSDASVTLYFLNSPNSTNVIQATANLGQPTTWQNLSTNVADGGGLWQFTDTNASATSVRYYRSQVR
jgi:beta-xylosidase